MTKLTAKVDSSTAGIRADKFLATVFSGISRSRAREFIDKGFVTANGIQIDPDHRTHIDELYICSVPEPLPSLHEPEAIPLVIIYEDSDIIVLNKEPGIVVHPSAGHQSGTLVNALLHHRSVLPVIGGEERPGIVHRLDKDTSGLLVVALNDKAMSELQGLFKNGFVKKKYLAIVRGTPRADGRIESSIGRSRRDRKKMASVKKGGRMAITEYKVLEVLGPFSLVELRILTGRTHQIRVHMSELGHPVAGDAQYGGRKAGLSDKLDAFKPGRQMLHAWKLSFPHPLTGKEMKLEAEIPTDFREALSLLRKQVM